MHRPSTRVTLMALCFTLLTAGLTMHTPEARAASAAQRIVNAPFGAAGRTSQVTINGLIGGVVTAGRVSVVIPPGAIAGTAIVTVTQPDTAQLVTELHVSPESLNHFRLPVLLVMHAGGLLSLPVLQDSRIEWFDPATGQWMPVPGSLVDLAGLSLQAPLWHFSTYRATGGKAGW